MYLNVATKLSYGTFKPQELFQYERVDFLGHPGNFSGSF